MRGSYGSNKQTAMLLVVSHLGAPSSGREQDAVPFGLRGLCDLRSEGSH